MQKVVAALTVGILFYCSGGLIGEASQSVDAEGLKLSRVTDTVSVGNVQLAFKYELPKPKPKSNITGRKRADISDEKSKQQRSSRTTSHTRNDKKATAAVKTKDTKTKNDRLTSNTRYEDGAQASQNHIGKQKASLHRSGMSKQEQKENEIILNYQAQKVAVELAERRLANAQDRSPRESAKLKKQLTAEKKKLKPLQAQFDALKITIHERNVSPQRCNIVKIAKSFVGTPYRYGGVGGRLETDCGQFIKDVLAEWGQKLRYRTACGQYYEYQEQKRIFADKSKLKPGDLIFYHTSDTRPASDDPAVISGGTYVYKGVTHVGIYQGNGCVIHASTSRGRVIENAMFEFAEIVGFGKTV